MLNRRVRLSLLLTLIYSLVGCGQQNTARQTQIAQNDSDTQAKFQDLSPADGTFKGFITLGVSKQVFAMTLQLQRVYQTTHSPDSQDPSDSIKIPKLSGNINFPALENLSLTDDSHFRELFDAMGDHSRATIDYGDYSPSDSTLILPYTIPNFSNGDYGQLSGTLVNGHYTGSWFSKGSALGTVGTFTLDKTGGQGT